MPTNKKVGNDHDWKNDRLLTIKEEDTTSHTPTQVTTAPATTAANGSQDKPLTTVQRNGDTQLGKIASEEFLNLEHTATMSQNNTRKCKKGETEQNDQNESWATPSNRKMDKGVKKNNKRRQRRDPRTWQL